MKITLENIGKKYNKEWIFKNISKEFLKDESYVVLGSNGSGKSTLLKVLSGFLTPNSGIITYEYNNKIVPIESVYKLVAYTSPYIDIFDEYTLKETFDFYTKFKNLKNNITYKEFVSIIELEKAEKKTIHQFSSGMKQRVKLGLAILSDSPILLLDEPTSNLDKNAIKWYQNLVIQNLEDRIVFVASNDQEEEFSFCKHILRIEDYKL